ncbi:hypothetical protein MIR68_003828 [Amoeboaphelidium protococcarum]|nr:hypothetical protein MIR68_003828 [Amoeboaphelidium protococcarum]
MKMILELLIGSLPMLNCNAMPAGGSEQIVVSSPQFEAFDNATPGVVRGLELLKILNVTIGRNLTVAYDCLKSITRHFIRTGDRRAEFSITYLAVTDETMKYLGPPYDGQKYIFNNATWVGQYMADFADIYREALLDWELGRVVKLPRSWASWLNVYAQNETLLAQNLFYGMNAHINYDLAYAGQRANEIQVDDSSTHLADNQIINRIFVDVSAQMMPVLVNIYKSAVDVSRFQGLLAFAVDYTVIFWRNIAWTHGAALASPKCGLICKKRHVLAIDALSNSVDWAITNTLPSWIKQLLKSAEGDDTIATLCKYEPWGYCQL